MNRKETVAAYRQICSWIEAGRLYSAIRLLEKLLRNTARSELLYELETLSENYRNLLRYAFGGYDDPQRQTIFDGMCTSLLSLADQCREVLLDTETPIRRAERKSLGMETGGDPGQAAARFEELFFGREVDKLLAKEPSIPVGQIDRMFRILWLTSVYPERLQHFIREAAGSEQVEWHEKCLIVTAVTLSLLDRFDPGKFRLLSEFLTMRENQVYQRSLTGILLVLIRYDTRVKFYPELKDILQLLTSEETIRQESEIILRQLLMARETEKITREFEEEVLPEMKKMMPKIEDKLQLSDPEEEDDPEDKNPGWKDMIDEVPGLYEKIEKFSRMQMEGGDVFMSTFQMLKRFDFFSAMSNWFVPFHRDHPELGSLTDSEEINDRLMESLEKAFYICNSDKYSFAINFRAIPEQQRTMIVANFEAEFAQMREMASEEQMLDQSLVSNSIYIQYIQDLYRFFKLFPHRAEFEDPFHHRILLHECYFYQTFFYRSGFQEKMAAFHFDHDHFNDAIEEYKGIMQKSGPDNEYYERIGYCYQKSGRYRMAIEYYRKAELFDTNRLWLLKKLGWCSLKIKDYRQALTYYADAAALQPDDVHLQLQAGQCYLHLKDYEGALHQYAKLRFFSPDNLKVMRPLAYCHFVLGKPEIAVELYAQVLGLADSPSAYDLMNSAHVKLCLAQREEALNLYRQSLLQESPGKAALMEAFDEDVPYLVKNGIPESEIPLIRDYISYQSEL